MKLAAALEAGKAPSDIVGIEAEQDSGLEFGSARNEEQGHESTAPFAPVRFDLATDIGAAALEAASVPTDKKGREDLDQQDQEGAQEDEEDPWAEAATGSEGAGAGLVLIRRMARRLLDDGPAEAAPARALKLQCANPSSPHHRPHTHTHTLPARCQHRLLLPPRLLPSHEPLI